MYWWVCQGDLPYITLGLRNVGFSAGDVSLKYSVYRDANNTPTTNAVGALVAASVLAADADLAFAKNRYAPTMADGARFEFSNSNSVDFCTALRNGAGSGLNTNLTHVRAADGQQTNVPFVVAAGGKDILGLIDQRGIHE
ncbi:MAG: hypothetical protein ACJA2O_002543 [Candidatus Azotimanducaceae bacterium]